MASASTSSALLSPPILFPHPSFISLCHVRRRRSVTCSSSPPDRRNSSIDGGRRTLSIGLVLLHCSLPLPNRAIAASLFDKYVKRKKLEPLEVYVPAVLLFESQFKDLDKYLDVEKPEYDVSRSLLRSGAAASLRVNIRAVAQYATDDGKGKEASDAVDRCLRALEDLDSLLLRAMRNDPTSSVGIMKNKISIALGALDSLLQTVPMSVLDKGRAIADAYKTSSPEQYESKPQDLDPDLKQLEAIL